MTCWGGSGRSLLKRLSSCSEHEGIIVGSVGTAEIKDSWPLSQLRNKKPQRRPLNPRGSLIARSFTVENL
jgi:hypothetical protein